MYNFDVKEQAEGVIQWTKDWFASKGPNAKALIGISGGVDSSTSAKILVKAIGKENVIGVKLPNGIQKDIDYSNKLIEELGIESYEINISDIYDAITNAVRVVAKNSGDFFPPDSYATNTPARIRMTTLYGIAAIVGNCYPVNTCNCSETIVGYDTIFGDSAGAVAPISRFTKTEVRAIAKYLGLPKELYEKTPIDGMSLNEDGSYKSDEDKLGFSYEELDSIIRCVSEGPNKDKIIAKMKSSAWKAKVINIEHYDPKLPMIEEFKF